MPLRNTANLVTVNVLNKKYLLHEFVVSQGRFGASAAKADFLSSLAAGLKACSTLGTADSMLMLKGEGLLHPGHCRQHAGGKRSRTPQGCAFPLDFSEEIAYKTLM
jgi:hypothetical protein